MKPARIQYTEHARLMLRERGLDRDWIEATVENPDFKEDDPERHGLMRAYRKIPEQDGRVLRVVYWRDDGGVRVITAFFDRSQK